MNHFSLGKVFLLGLAFTEVRKRDSRMTGVAKTIRRGAKKVRGENRSTREARRMRSWKTRKRLVTMEMAFHMTFQKSKGFHEK
jgi:hypothetical protein